MPAVNSVRVNRKNYFVMKTLRFLKSNRYRLLRVFLVGCAILLSASLTFAQDPAGKKKENKKMQQGTLEEAKVTARVITLVEEVGPMRVRLNVLNPTGKTVRVSVLNYENQPVFQDAFQGKEYNKVLNFTSTQAGRYSLHVAGKKTSEVRRFEIEKEEKRNMTPMPLENPKNTDVMATIYKTSPTKVVLHLLNNTGKTVEYIIRDTNQEVLYRGYVKEEKFFKPFDMSAVTDGKYTVEVKYLADKVASRAFDLNTIYERTFSWVDKRGKPLQPGN
jgi:hypothetical protein